MLITTPTFEATRMVAALANDWHPGGWCAGPTRRPREIDRVEPCGLAPKVISSLKDQCYAYPSKRGQGDELEYMEIDRKTPAEAGGVAGGWDPADVTGAARARRPLRSQGHLIESPRSSRRCHKCRRSLEASLKAVMYRGKAYSVPQSWAPRLWSPAGYPGAAKVVPQNLDEFIRGV